MKTLISPKSLFLLNKCEYHLPHVCVNGTGSRDAIKSADESKSSEKDSDPSYIVVTR